MLLQYCGKCHADQIEQVEQSAMATGKSVINITRYAWGAQEIGENIYIHCVRKKRMESSFVTKFIRRRKPVDVVFAN